MNDAISIPGSNAGDTLDTGAQVLSELEIRLPARIVDQYLSVTTGGVAIVTIKGDGKPVLSQQVLSDLSSMFDALKGLPDLTGVVITSSEKGIYGADARDIAALQLEGEESLYGAVETGKELLLSRLAKIEPPVVAAVTGTWLGGGLELALACDAIVMSSSPDPNRPKKETKVGLVEVMLGVIPGFGGCWNLYSRVGLKNAIDLICSAKTITATTAWKLGIADHVVEPLRLMQAAEQMIAKLNAEGFSYSSVPARVLDKITSNALRLARNPIAPAPKKLLPGLFYWFYAIALAIYKAGFASCLAQVEKFALKQIRAKTRGNMPAPEAALKVLMKCVSHGREAAMRLESTEFVRMAVTHESRNLVGIFLAKSGAKSGITMDPLNEISCVGVIGLGTMGAPIAALLRQSGYKVVALDAQEKYLASGKDRVRQYFQDLIDSGDLSADEARDLFDTIAFTTDYAALSCANLVIEVAPENLALKQSIKVRVDAVMTRPYYWASNTSTQSNGRIVAGTQYEEQSGGLHFFNPVGRMPLVEVIAHPKTSEHTADLFAAFAASLGKLPKRCTDRNGFIVNSLIGPYAMAALNLVGKGVPIDRIDRAAKDFGLPMGPFQLADLVGHDVLVEVLSTLRDNLGDRFAVPEFLIKTRELGLLGNKGGEGFYVKNTEKPGPLNRFTGGLIGGKPKPFVVNPKIRAILKDVREHKMSIHAIQFVLFDALGNEAMRLMSEGVVENAQDIDHAAVFGMGYPAYRGGPVTFINHQGVNVFNDRLALECRIWGENYRPVGNTAQTVYQAHWSK